jgi:hypothetical protein
MTMSDSMDIRGLSAIIAIAVAMAVVTLLAMEVGDVVGETALHLPAAGAGEEGHRLPLQVREHLGAQAVHDLLADVGGHPGLDDAEE